VAPLSKADARARAQTTTSHRLRQSEDEYRWGWVFQPDTDAYGPGPIAVTREGDIIVFSSARPVTFSDDAAPVDPQMHEVRPWYRRLFGRP
jgi:hypothetical protein